MIDTVLIGGLGLFMKLSELEAAVEAVLFASGEAVELDRIAEVLELDKLKALELVESLADKLRQQESALQILRLEDKVQICTKKDYIEYIRRALDIRRNMPLSQAAMEVLAIVCYNQPVTKAFVEQVRGVDCSGVIQSLCTKGLIEEKGRLELPGRPLIYGTTDSLLRCLGLSSLDQLPPLEEEEQEGDKVIEGVFEEDEGYQMTLGN